MKGAMAVVAVLAFAIGAAVGVFVVYGKLDEARAERDALTSERSELQTKVSRLEQARDEALAKVQQALARVNDFDERAAAEPAPDQAALDWTAALEDTAPPAEETPADTGDDRRRRGRREDGGPGEGRTAPPDQDARRAEMRERMAGMRDATFQALDDAIAGSTDPAEQQRLAALAETTATMMDLFGQMREAQTDEERDALRATLGELHQNQRALIEEQQQYQTRKILDSYGISSAQKQDEFMATLEQMRDDPVLSSPMLSWGGGPPRGGGGRGPGPGR